jgi:2C-methyl-D-erythritol 2,4-cyclodiphosphate synthase
MQLLMLCCCPAGQLFPDTDPKWKGASSDIFVKEAVSQLGVELMCALLTHTACNCVPKASTMLAKVDLGPHCAAGWGQP